MKRPLLLPLVPLYAAGVALRELRLRRGWEPLRRLRYPVISVGNLSTGGSGKTPLVITLAGLLASRGIHVDVLSRGYGRKNREAARVQPDGTAEQYGDEPLLIARETGVPVYVAAERYDAGQLAEQESAASKSDGLPLVHILDDGFQHRQLARDIDIVVMTREDWHDFLLPAGNLRESTQAVQRASVLAVPASDSQFEADLRGSSFNGPIWRIRRRMDVPQVSGPVAAFCGIARPEQLFAGLEGAGLDLADRIVFSDHHRYTDRDIDEILARARTSGAISLVTTRKDEVRLGKLTARIPQSLPLKCADLTIAIEDEVHVGDWLVERFAKRDSLTAL
jgi:tetraacyldisaccharide 4'-kinase